MGEPKLKADKEAGNLSDGAMTYVLECIAERITGERAKDDFSSKYTEWGNDNEPIAIAIYEHLQKVKVDASKYIPRGENFGGSPDGLVNEDGGIEIKCPYTITAHLVHCTTIDLKKDAKDYFWQVIGYMIVTGREWFDFISYHPKYPGIYQFKRMRMYRNNFLPEVAQAEKKINKATEKFNEILKSFTNGR